jgi:hypothetical protein
MVENRNGRVLSSVHAPRVHLDVALITSFRKATGERAKVARQGLASPYSAAAGDGVIDGDEVFVWQIDGANRDSQRED